MQKLMPASIVAKPILQSETPWPGDDQYCEAEYHRLCLTGARNIEVLDDIRELTALWSAAVAVVHSPAETDVFIALDGDVASYRLMLILDK